MYDMGVKLASSFFFGNFLKLDTEVFFFFFFDDGFFVLHFMRVLKVNHGRLTYLIPLFLTLTGVDADLCAIAFRYVVRRVLKGDE